MGKLGQEFSTEQDTGTRWVAWRVIDKKDQQRQVVEGPAGQTEDLEV